VARRRCKLVRRWARLRGLPVQAAIAKGEANLRRLGMSELLQPACAPVLERREAADAGRPRAAREPELLVLDEPTDGLDPLGRALVRKVILEECAQGRTVFINSHLLSETERVCTRVGILHDGQLVREEVLGRQVGEERATSALVVESELDARLQAALGARRPGPDGACVYLIEHDDLDGLNVAIDRVRLPAFAWSRSAASGATWKRPSPRLPPPPRARSSPPWTPATWSMPGPRPRRRCACPGDAPGGGGRSGPT